MAPPNVKILKTANSKGQLAKAVEKLMKACEQYKLALRHYANESHWAVKGEDIVWVGDDDPTSAAQITLGMRGLGARKEIKSSGSSRDTIPSGSTGSGNTPSADQLGQGHSGDAGSEVPAR